MITEPENHTGEYGITVIDPESWNNNQETVEWRICLYVIELVAIDFTGNSQ